MRLQVELEEQIRAIQEKLVAKDLEEKKHEEEREKLVILNFPASPQEVQLRPP